MRRLEGTKDAKDAKDALTTTGRDGESWQDDE